MKIYIHVGAQAYGAIGSSSAQSTDHASLSESPINIQSPGFEFFGNDIGRLVFLVSGFRVLMEIPAYLREFDEIGIDLPVSFGLIYVAHGSANPLYQPFTRSHRSIMVPPSNTS
jgi:hypothetical protein